MNLKSQLRLLQGIIFYCYTVFNLQLAYDKIDFPMRFLDNLERRMMKFKPYVPMF
ncbi:MAG: hypothetical protein ACI86M_000906 [Saprospiraceae bacterium]|jgi:hypothetical protein